MSAPTPAVRTATYDRDNHRCVSCGSTGPLQYQHRAAVRADARLLTEKQQERFWSQVQRSEPGCWEWLGARNWSGHGRFYAHCITFFAHRVAHQLTHGATPEGMVIDHLCWNSGCVRPDHLRATTQMQNARNLAGAHRDSRSGVRGVSWDSSRKRWRADICVGYKRIAIGRFLTIQEATAAVQAARLEYFGVPS